jgi:hypothetical protein
MLRAAGSTLERAGRNELTSDDVMLGPIKHEADQA